MWGEHILAAILGMTLMTRVLVASLQESAVAHLTPIKPHAWEGFFCKDRIASL